MNRDMQTVIRQITDRIVQEYKPLKIILFGSYAWGTPHRDSDIDLFIVKDTGKSPVDRQVMVRKIIHDLRYKIPMDILVMTPEEIEKRLAIGDQFCAKLIRDGKRLYAA